MCVSYYTGKDDPISWSEPYFHGVNNWESRANSWVAVPEALLKDKPLIDAQIAQHAIETLRRVAPAAEVGGAAILRCCSASTSHICPFVFPEKHVTVLSHGCYTFTGHPYAPVNMPDVAWFNYGGCDHIRTSLNLTPVVL